MLDPRHLLDLLRDAVEESYDEQHDVREFS